MSKRRLNLNPFGWIRPSLLKQLMLPVVALWACCAILATSAAYLLAGRSTNSSFDRLLADDAYALASQLRWNDGTASFKASKETADSLVFDSLSLSHYTVRTVDGRKLMGDLVLPAPEHLAAASKEPVFFEHLSSSGTPLRAVALRLQPALSDEAVLVLVAESKTKRTQVRNQIATAIFLPAALAGFFIVPLFYYSIRRALDPTRELSALVVRHGDDNLPPLPVDEVPEELQELVAHTNSLLQRLQNSVTEQRRFIADAAHQLQTPMAGIRLLVGDMRRTQRADPEQPMDAEVLAHLDEVATRGARMVKQLLAYARVSDEAVVQIENFDAVAAVLDPTDRLSTAAQAAGKSLQIDSPIPPHHALFLQGSSDLLAEVVSNLVDNAIRYGGAHIRLELRHQGTRLVVRVQDDGPALDAEARAHLWLPFWRGKHGQPEGSGLGLSIAQRIIERLGGSLALLPAGCAGTCFEISLPCTSAPLPTPLTDA